ncbi:MAG: hypothetical protein ACM3KE_10340 [Hyphomicrobiales bacterium]
MLRFLYVFLPMLLIGGTVASAQPFVPGEMLVLFSAQSPGRAAVERALRSIPPELAALDPVAASLEAGAGVPLQPIRISGGNWVLMSVDSKRLTDRVAGLLRTRARVKSVEIMPLEKMRGVQAGRPNGLRVQFNPGSAESGIVSGKISGGSAEPLAGLVEQIGAAFALPLKGQAGEHGRLYLEIDYRALTAIVVERLKTLPGVESVQLNYTVGFRSVP